MTKREWKIVEEFAKQRGIPAREVGMGRIVCYADTTDIGACVLDIVMGSASEDSDEEISERVAYFTKQAEIYKGHVIIDLR